MDDDRRAGKTLITRSALLALVPIAGYYLAVTRETSYCEHFGIPRELIVINPTTVLQFSAALIAGACAMIWISHVARMLSELLRIEGSMFDTLLRSYAVLFIPALIGIAYYRSDWKGALLSLVFVWPVLVDIILAFFKRRRFDSFSAALQAELSGWKGESLGLFAFIQPAFHQWLGVVLYGVLATSLCGLLGEAEAKTQDRFLVPESTPDLAVVRIYGNRVVCIGFDATSREIKDRIVLIDLGVTTAQTFTWQKIGPLTASTALRDAQGT